MAKKILSLTQKEFIEGTLRKLSDRTMKKIRETLISSGENAAANLLGALISKKTGIPADKAAFVASKILKFISKEIRRKLSGK